MRLLSASIAIALLSSIWFSALIDRVLSSPSQTASPASYTENPNRVPNANPDWVKRWNLGAQFSSDRG